MVADYRCNGGSFTLSNPVSEEERQVPRDKHSGGLFYLEQPRGGGGVNDQAWEMSSAPQRHEGRGSTVGTPDLRARERKWASNETLGAECQRQDTMPSGLGIRAERQRQNTMPSGI